ncbi:MAG: hypothetical protein ACR2NN_22840 [Bryobacteraceae bacterium]
MPTALMDAPLPPFALDPPRKRWTRAECSTLEASGLLDQQHLELVEGELISKMGKKRAHVNALTLLLARRIRSRPSPTPGPFPTAEEMVREDRER